MQLAEDYFEVYRDSRDRRTGVQDVQDVSWNVGPSADEFQDILKTTIEDAEREVECETEIIREEYEDELREARQELIRHRSGDELRATRTQLEHAQDEIYELLIGKQDLTASYKLLAEQNRRTIEQLNTAKLELAAAMALYESSIKRLEEEHAQEIAARFGPTDELRRQLEEARNDLRYWNTEHKCR